MGLFRFQTESDHLKKCVEETTPLRSNDTKKEGTEVKHREHVFELSLSRV